jgi:hypothetical protein
LERLKKEADRKAKIQEMIAGAEVLFGYGHITGIPLCECEDPGDYARLLCPDPKNPLRCILECWCGNTAGLVFDDMMERAQFIENRGQ